jgi:hypothetical protein
MIMLRTSWWHRAPRRPACDRCGGNCGACARQQPWNELPSVVDAHTEAWPRAVERDRGGLWDELSPPEILIVRICTWLDRAVGLLARLYGRGTRR